MKLPPREYGSSKARARWSFLTRTVVLPFQEFLHTEGLGSLVLLVSALAALVWANSPWRATYENFFQTHFSIRFGSFLLDGDLRELINDGLMAIFFFVVTLEIKRELTDGALADRYRAALPVAGAIGGMIAPAFLYAIVNIGGPNLHGWGIPMATDIAFAVGVVLLLKGRVPDEVRVFLLALAVVDDLGAILVIAAFYSHGLSVPALVVAGVTIALVAGLRKGGLRSPIIQAPLAIVLWVAVLKSGLHATLAGVAMAALTPTRPAFSLADFPDSAARLLRKVRDHLDVGDMDHAESVMGQFEELSRGTEPALERRLRLFHPWSSFVALPLFALANSGVTITMDSITTACTGRVAWGIVLGLLIGKPVGIVLASWLAVRSGLARLPVGVRWPHLIGVGIVAGIGFTVSLFVGDLAFEDVRLISEAKLAILASSVAAGVAGFAFFRLGIAENGVSEHVDGLSFYQDDLATPRDLVDQ